MFTSNHTTREFRDQTIDFLTNGTTNAICRFVPVVHARSRPAAIVLKRDGFRPWCAWRGEARSRRGRQDIEAAWWARVHKRQGQALRAAIGLLATHRVPLPLCKRLPALLAGGAERRTGRLHIRVHTQPVIPCTRLTYLGKGPTPVSPRITGTIQCWHWKLATFIPTHRPQALLSPKESLHTQFRPMLKRLHRLRSSPTRSLQVRTVGIHFMPPPWVASSDSWLAHLEQPPPTTGTAQTGPLPRASLLNY